MSSNIDRLKVLDLARQTDAFCENTDRVFNYTVMALTYFLSNGYLPDEACSLQLDERNGETETNYFLENYLNTELTLSGVYTGSKSYESAII